MVISSERTPLGVHAGCIRGRVSFFDNAEVYGDGQAEIQMGNTLKRMRWPREGLVIKSDLLSAARIEVVRRLEPIAADLSCSLEENMRALDVVSMLTDDVMARIEEILANRPGPPWYL